MERIDKQGFNTVKAKELLGLFWDAPSNIFLDLYNFTYDVENWNGNLYRGTTPDGLDLIGANRNLYLNSVFIKYLAFGEFNSIDKFFRKAIGTKNGNFFTHHESRENGIYSFKHESYEYDKTRVIRTTNKIHSVHGTTKMEEHYQNDNGEVPFNFYSFCEQSLGNKLYTTYCYRAPSNPAVVVMYHEVADKNQTSIVYNVFESSNDYGDIKDILENPETNVISTNDVGYSNMLRAITSNNPNAIAEQLEVVKQPSESYRYDSSNNRKPNAFEKIKDVFSRVNYRSQINNNQ